MSTVTLLQTDSIPLGRPKSTQVALLDPTRRSTSVKYLNVHLLRGRSLKFDIMPAKHAFYAKCNSIFMHGADVDEFALLPLQESYSLPVLMTAMASLSLKCKQLNELNVCWNNVVRKLFNYNKWASVKSVLFHIDHLIMTRKINFDRRLHASKNRTFMSFLSRGHDNMCHAVFTQNSLSVIVIVFHPMCFHCFVILHFVTFKNE